MGRIQYDWFARLVAACILAGCTSVDSWTMVVTKSLGKPPPDWKVIVSPDSRHIAYWGG